jgi:hypothetical protein
MDESLEMHGCLLPKEDIRKTDFAFSIKLKYNEFLNNLSDVFI